MIHDRDKTATILLKKKNNQITDKSSKFPIPRLSLLVICLKYSTLHQAQEIKFLSQNANLNKPVQKLTHNTNSCTNTVQHTHWKNYNLGMLTTLNQFARQPLYGLPTPKPRDVKMQEFTTTPNRSRLHALHLLRNGWAVWWGCAEPCFVWGWVFKKTRAKNSRKCKEKHRERDWSHSESKKLW